MQFRKYLSFPAVFAHHNIVEEETMCRVWFLGNLSCLNADRHVSPVFNSGWTLLPFKSVLCYIFLVK